MRYDVIVIGAGPSGSTAARECAARGLSVLLLDKAAFPRDKPCGGGVTARAARLLPFSLAPVVEQTSYGIRFSLRRHPRVTQSSLEPLVYFTQRSRLDLFLLDQARKAGATLRERTSVREIERRPLGKTVSIAVRTDRELFEGRTLVAADGATGTTARLAGLKVGRWMGMAIEANITSSNPFPDQWKNCFGLDAGDIPGGYGWIFPKKDHLNFGVGSLPARGFDLKYRLNQLVRSYGFNPASLWGLRGFPLPIRQAGAPLVDGPLLLVGDAAGLIDPFSGEGIHSALLSGMIAAKHLRSYLAGEAADLQGYRKEMEAELLEELWLSYQLFMMFHLVAPTIAEQAHRSKAGWKQVSGIIRGERRMTDIKKSVRPAWAAIDFAIRPRLFPFFFKLIRFLNR